MCGILFRSGEDATPDAFDQALGLMAHRGPDFQQVWRDGDRALGHTRLSIQDPKRRSDQPFTAADNTHKIIFNGEVYNFKELRRQFNLTTKTTSDTEVLLELYVKLGAKCLEYLNGMFAFIIYNTETREVFAARDRLGIKPLYWYASDDTTILSSEIAPILALAGDQAYDAIGIRQYLKARAFFRGHSLYENITMFPAGHYLKNGRLTKYWDLPEAPITDKWEDETIRELLVSAVDYRLIADVPLGSYLSGGVDSTIISGLTGRPDTWTVGFAELNEFEWGKLAADHFGANHTEVLIDAEEFLETAQRLITYRREPLSVPNEVLIYKMTKAVAEKNTVVLSGEGADELFFGYDRIFRWAAENPWDLRGFDAHYSYGKHRDDAILDYILAPFERRKNAIDKVASFFQVSHLHGLLRRVDNSTMMCSVEARVPFVDHRLVEYMYGAPVDYRMQDGVVKSPLKRIFSDILPAPIIDRKKVGFPVPLEAIFKDIPTSGMDSWLDLNLNTLIGSDWPALKETILHGDAG